MEGMLLVWILFKISISTIFMV